MWRDQLKIKKSAKLNLGALFLDFNDNFSRLQLPIVNFQLSIEFDINKKTKGKFF